MRCGTYFCRANLRQNVKCSANEVQHNNTFKKQFFSRDVTHGGCSFLLSQTGLLLDHFISLQRKSTGREGRVISIHQLCIVKYTLRVGGLGQGYFTAVVVSVSDKQSPTETSHVALKVSCDFKQMENARYFFRERTILVDYFS